MKKPPPPQDQPKSQKFSRLQLIEAMLKEQNSVSIAAICQKFGISDQTARSDLAALEKQGLCRKAYGGAVSCVAQAADGVISFATAKSGFESTNPVLISALQQKFISESPRLFRTATTIFLPGDIFLLALFKEPGDFFPAGATIFTNSIAYASNNAGQSGCHIILLPGNVDKKMAITTGTVLEDYIRGFAKISCAIFYINYIDRDSLTVGFGSELHGRMAQELIERHKLRRIIFIAGSATGENERAFHYLTIAPKSIDLLIQPVLKGQNRLLTAPEWACDSFLVEI